MAEAMVMKHCGFHVGLPLLLLAPLLWEKPQFQRQKLGSREAEQNLQWLLTPQDTEIGIQDL